MAADVSAVEDRIGWRFAQPELLKLALTHASALEGRPGACNERLEFLGDRVLGLVIAEQLFTLFPQAPESSLAPWLNGLVKKSACARAARRAGIGPALHLSKSEEASGGRDKEGILADACEAVIAALYLDGGLAPARAFIERFWGGEIEAVAAIPRDAKTALQEWAAAKGLPAPDYAVLAQAGPDHAPQFRVEARVGAAKAVGVGGSKRAAETAAAEALLREAGAYV